MQEIFGNTGAQLDSHVQDTIDGQSLCPRSVSCREHRRNLHGTRPVNRTNRATHRERQSKSTLHEHRQACVSHVWAARPQPSSAVARQQTDGFGKLTMSETPCQREGTTSDRHHQGLSSPTKRHTVSVPLVRLWWQDALANVREKNLKAKTSARTVTPTKIETWMDQGNFGPKTGLDHWIQRRADGGGVTLRIGP